ncbi:hypothetical protein GE21DRAFT_1055644 [Neurospora crassa]|nr:hypothetical protein GE21DRAFT_1055644 [Neurospora crassa]
MLLPLASLRPPTAFSTVRPCCADPTRLTDNLPAPSSFRLPSPHITLAPPILAIGSPIVVDFLTRTLSQNHHITT